MQKQSKRRCCGRKGDMKVNNNFLGNLNGEKKKTFSMAVTSPSVQSMIMKSLRNEKAAARLTSTLISAVSASEQLKACDAGTIVASALRGEGMGLIYGHGYYVVPYGSVASFILSYKGYIQLAMSTGFYEDIDVTDVRDGEIEGRDRRTGKPVVNLAKYDTDEERAEHKIIGYYGYYKLNNSSFRFEYWPMDKLLRHADRYSPAFKLEKYNALISGELDAKEQAKLLNGTPWYDLNGGQDKMCKKTVLRSLLNSGYAPLSNEVRSYFNEDGDDTVIATGDGTETEPVIPTTGHVVEDDTPTAKPETPSASPTASPESAAEPNEGNDTAPTRKRAQSAAEGKTETKSEAKDYSAGFFGEGEQ